MNSPGESFSHESLCAYSEPPISEFLTIKFQVGRFSEALDFNLMITVLWIINRVGSDGAFHT